MSAPTRSLLAACAACTSLAAACTWLVVRQLRANRSVIHEHIGATRTYERAVTDLASLSSTVARPPQQRNNTTTPAGQATT